MAKNGKDKNYVSFWFWLFALFIAALPCIGIVMVVIWALVGSNESRKNYFRALIAWFLILTVLWCGLATASLAAANQKMTSRKIRVHLCPSVVK